MFKNYKAKRKREGKNMEYTYNPETEGICSLGEFARHGCLKCPKRGMCEFIVNQHNEEMSEKNDTSNRPRQHSKCVLPNR